ncbi:Uu.00g124480.m01.CDS01 [Anthostomella pinea]|uniref:Uu.00g124480.m01.CDS01 n=1 Tax=Anthostomella pinea TaxID=933095 RepID=A0AAI8YHL1_9PEZI|nr:Uu.00g124480.m01.CDS01 [Anthostomella pinea]
MATHPYLSNISPEKEISVVDLLRQRFRASPPAISPADVDLSGKTAIITGGSSGLGFHCGTELFKLGLDRLIITCIAGDEAKLKAAEVALTLTIGKSIGTTTEVWPLDLSNYDSITSFVDRVKTLDRIHYIILNSDAVNSDFEQNASTKHENMLQVNYISNALLCILLLPILREKKDGTPTRVVWVTADSRASFKEDFTTPIFAALDEQPVRWDFAQRYAMTKLLCQLFIVELTKRVPPSVAVVTAVNPGLCRGTNLYRAMKGIPGIMKAITNRIVSRSSKVGARELTDAAVKHGEELHGQYLMHCKLKPMAPLTNTPDGAELSDMLWVELIQELAPFDAGKAVAEMGV